jgi:hypothetical protein
LQIRAIAGDLVALSKNGPQKALGKRHVELPLISSQAGSMMGCSGEMVMSEVEREQIRKRIEEMVSQHWALTQKALLLSKLGGPIKKEFPNAVSVMEMKLRDFVRTCSKLRLIAHPLISEKIGAIPIDAPIPENVINLFEEPTSPSPEAKPYFARVFWRAFHTPLVERRFVIPSGANQPVRIIEGELEEGETAYEILESDISLMPSETPMVEKVRAVSDRIREWLRRNNLSGQQFREHADISAQGQKSLAADSVLKPSVSLTEALADLHPSDQARISIPLDIVLKMLSQRR